jgi:hypothetical protein
MDAQIARLATLQRLMEERRKGEGCLIETVAVSNGDGISSDIRRVQQDLEGSTFSALDSHLDPPSTVSQLSVCTTLCDVDCHHIESIRFYRYLGELGLSACGVLELLGVCDIRVSGVLEIAGLCSGLATLIVRAATHARRQSDEAWPEEDIA